MKLDKYNIIILENITMKRLICITTTLLFSFALVFTAVAAGNGSRSVQHMSGPGHHGPWFPGPWNPPEPNPGDPDQPGPGDTDQPNPWEGGHYGHNHGNIKIADLYLDGEPEIVLLEDETLTVMDNQGEVLFTKTVEGVEDHHNGGWWMMPGYGNRHNGMVTLEVTDFDGDGIPEIIILDAEKLIVLDNNGDPKTTITLP